MPADEAGEVAQAVLDAAFANGATHVSLHAERLPEDLVSGLPRHPFVLAVKPVVEALGATLVPADEREPGDMPLRWEGSIIAAVRMAPLHGALDRLIDAVEREFGAPLPSLAREDKQRADPAARRARRVHACDVRWKTSPTRWASAASPSTTTSTPCTDDRTLSAST